MVEFNSCNSILIFHLRMDAAKFAKVGNTDRGTYLERDDTDQIKIALAHCPLLKHNLEHTSSFAKAIRIRQNIRKSRGAKVSNHEKEK